MLSFFIALFGGLYYVERYAYEKSKLNKYNRNALARQKHRDDLRSQLCISREDENRVVDYVKSGNHYEEICDNYAEDFEFVFGSKWIDVLKIPPLSPMSTPDAHYFDNRYDHIYWVYRLILASKGKVDDWSFDMGMPIKGDKEYVDMGVKFAQCMERRLRQAGYPNFTFVFDEGGVEPAIRIDTLCYRSYRRLWD